MREAEEQVVEATPVVAEAPQKPLRQRRKIQPQERLDRRKLMAQLLANHVDREEIVAIMVRQFQMPRQTTEALIRATYREWAEEEVERRPFYRSAAIKRIQAHIVQASKAKAWNAVAALERTLAEIQGTREPVEHHVQIDANIREAVVGLLTQMPEADIERLAGKYRAHQVGAPAPAQLVLDTVGDAAE